MEYKMEYKEVQGCLISLAQNGSFDVITHGCNCFCNMGSGIAPQMARAFGVNLDRFYKLEHPNTRGDINKLGQIEYETILYNKVNHTILRDVEDHTNMGENWFELTVVNSYTQHVPAAHLKPLDYEALTLCMRKINKVFPGQRIGLPKIGAGLAGGDWERIKVIIQTELKDCDVTVVIFKQ